VTGTRIIRVWMTDGLVSVKAAPSPVPGLVINENPGTSGGWNITHLASGACVAGRFEDPEHALRIAVELGPVCDWTISGAELIKLPGGRREWLRALARAGALEHGAGPAVPRDRIAAMEPLS
jgi:hypothetical protein